MRAQKNAYSVVTFLLQLAIVYFKENISKHYLNSSLNINQLLKR